MFRKDFIGQPGSKFSPAAGVDDQLLIKRHTGQYRGRTVLWFPTNSDHLSTVELASKTVLLHSSRMVARETSRLDVSRPLAMLMSPNKNETTIHWYHYRGDMVVRKR